MSTQSTQSKKTKMLSDKQEQFLRNDLHRINLLYGSVRSGKTWISLLKWALWIGQQPFTCEFLMVGKTITTLKRNCFGLLQTLIGDHFTYNLSQKKAYIFGHVVWLEGANDARSEGKIRGMTLKGAYIDELTQIPSDFYLMCLSRLSETSAALIATTNPDHPKHYVKTDIIDNPILDKQVIKFGLDDNIHLDETYKENLRKEYTGVYYMRYIMGEFVRAEGTIFRDFAENPNKWDITLADFMQETKHSFEFVEVGFDLGGNGSAYALVCVAKSNDVYYVLKAQKQQPQDLDMHDIEKYVQTFCRAVESKYGAKIDIINCDHIAVVVNSLNDNTEYRAQLTYKPPLEDRPFAISKLFATNRIRFLEGECEDLKEELQNLVYDDKCEKPIPLDDGTMQIDTWDALIYGMSGDWLYVSD